MHPENPVFTGRSVLSLISHTTEIIMKFSSTVAKLFVLVATMGVLTSCVSKKKYEEAMNRAAAEKSALESALSEAQAENEQLQGEFDKLEQNLQMSKEEIAALSETVKANNAQIQSLKDAISEVFVDFDSDDVSVEEREGKLYITFANSILFNSGRATLTDSSEMVVAKLASVFNTQPDLTIQVEGHTDNEPVVIHRRRYKDNWELSVARSLAVVRALEEAGMTGDLIASGKGDTQPIASNDTEEGRAMNRRTEFIVLPQIEGLYKMYESDFEGMGASN